MNTTKNLFATAVLLIALAAACSSQEKKENLLTGVKEKSDAFEVDTTWVEVDEMPVFAGGEQALMQFIVTNVKYPEQSKKDGIQGRVIVKFRVDTKGTVDRVSIVQKASPELDAEAMRVVGMLPAFEKPGINKGRPVPVWYMVPISYALK